MSSGRGYAARHLEHGDYYAEGEKVTGQWFGKGAEKLGLEGQVEHEQFERVRQGFLEQARGEPGRFRIVDSGGDPARTESQVRAALGDLLPAATVSSAGASSA